MSDLNQTLAAILQSLNDSVKTASQFAVDQLPELVYQYLLYGRITTSLNLFLTLLLEALLIGLFVWAIRSKWEDRFLGGWHEARILALVASVSLHAASIPFLMRCSSSFVLVWFAPKIWLLQEVASLIK